MSTEIDTLLSKKERILQPSSTWVITIRLIMWFSLALVSLLLSVWWFNFTYSPWIQDYASTLVGFYYQPTGVNKFRKLGEKCLPVHMVCGPIALFGGMIQMIIGFSGRGRTWYHKYVGLLVLTANVGGLASAIGLALALVGPRGIVECVQLLVLAAYTGICMGFAYYFVKVHKDVLHHKEFVLRSMTGWFNFVTNRIVYYQYPGRDSSWDTLWQELGTLIAIEIILCQLRREKWW